MALVDQLPVIDDRTYDDLVAEALTRIPRLTPEWTDYNPGDPGRALVELFAWLSEMMIFRLGQTPEQNYVRFLELIGLELIAAQPASAEIQLAVKTSFLKSDLFVPARKQFSASSPDGPVIFETEEGLNVMNGILDAVQSYDGFSYRDLTSANADLDQTFQPFGPSPVEGRSLLLGFTSSATFTEKPFTLGFWNTPSATSSEQQASRCGDGAEGIPLADLAWEYFDGSEWRGLNVQRDETLSLTRSGIIELRHPEPDRFSASIAGRISDRPRFWIRARIAGGQFAVAPQMAGIRNNIVRVLQAETVRDEVLGGSDGRTSQQFKLTFKPVLDGTLSIDVNEGDGWVTWTEVDDFYESGPNDRHYTLNRTSGIVTFGDGRGRIPVANPARPNSSIVARVYRHGGGPKGNVGAGAIDTILASVPGLDANSIANIGRASGGRAEETLPEAKLRVPNFLRGTDRAVTASDFESLAVQVDAVRRAKALPLHNPNCPGVETPGAVTVIVVPESDDDAPVPSDRLLRNVCTYLEPRRLLTTELYVRPPRYVKVVVEAEVVVDSMSDPQVVQEQARATVSAYLNPLEGGDDGTGWPFGGTLHYAGLFRRLLVDGVVTVETLRIWVDDTEIAPCTDTPIPADALIELRDVSVLARIQEQGSMA